MGGLIGWCLSSDPLPNVAVSQNIFPPPTDFSQSRFSYADLDQALNRYIDVAMSPMSSADYIARENAIMKTFIKKMYRQCVLVEGSLDSGHALIDFMRQYNRGADPVIMQELIDWTRYMAFDLTQQKLAALQSVVLPPPEPIASSTK